MLGNLFTIKGCYYCKNKVDKKCILPTAEIRQQFFPLKVKIPVYLT